MFQFTPNYFYLIDHQSASFISTIYHQLLVDLSMRWGISKSILDYNLARLRKCAYKCLKQLKNEEHCSSNSLIAATFTIEELPLALEFYQKKNNRICIYTLIN
jgi:hypothetical protein